MIPFLKWPGGKRWLIQRYSSIFPKHFDNYIEPFLGSGSVYFHLQPKRALLSDKNKELISIYKGIKQNWTELTSLLAVHHHRHSKEYYYQIRSEVPPGLIEQAARLIYLNRTCFNGIYRVNRQGVFNVPIGTRQNVVFPTDDFKETARILHSARINAWDFEKSINEGKANDFIFADPPYTVRHNNNGFTKYNEILFSWEDQERLAESLIRAKNRGVIIISTNANHHSLKELYLDAGFSVKTVSRFSPISATITNRRQFEEILITANKYS